MTDSALYQTQTLYNLRLPTRDGIELSANLWLPVPKSEGETFPAILEMIPYRKDDWRYNSDHQHGAYFAQRGFAFCRLDVRGTGSSEGIAYDEYTQAETRDGYDVVEWLAAQPWCNGNVGMWGISYGGFTAIQVAMLQPPHLKAIIPMYATDDRYTDDVHYLGGCLTVSELAQYAVSMVGMNAMPPKLDYVVDAKWAEQWKERLEKTPPWLIEWLKQQTDGSYWRNGSLAPDYSRIKCAIFNIGGWMDEYVNSVLRMQERCTQAAGVKGLIGNWVHSYPDSAYPGPNLDHLHEMARFFDYWLKGNDNGVMDESPLTLFRFEYTDPKAFPPHFNGQWIGEPAYPLKRSQQRTLYLGDRELTFDVSRLTPQIDHYPHRPTHGTRAALCWGAGSAPNGLARDLRPDEALIPTYTSEPLTEPLDVIGFPEAVLYLSCSAPVANVVVRLADVAPEGTSFQVTAGVLNLTHREGHTNPQPLIPNHVYEIHVPMRAVAYRFLPGHRLRLSVSSAYWPVIWPSPYQSDNYLHRGQTTPSRLILPVVSASSPAFQPPSFKTTPPELLQLGGGSDDPPVWQIVEDVISQTVTVNVYEGGATLLPDGRSLFSSERIEMTAHHVDPLKTFMCNDVVYRLEEHGYKTEIRSSGSVRCTETEFIMDIQLQVMLNGTPFFQKSWLESVPRQLM